MIRTGKRTIRDGKEYDKYFKSAQGKVEVWLKNASVCDTVFFMKKIIKKTLSQTKPIARQLQLACVKKSCKAVWDFCFNHFQYTKDAPGKEQVRSPYRSWADRKRGIDCDCFTVLIGSILANMNIPFTIRLTRYTSSSFEHVYPVAFTPNGEQVVIDCVVHKFNYEAPYKQKKDVNMDFEYLNGVEMERYNEFGELVRFENDLPIDAEDLFLDDLELDGLEGRKERLARRAKRKAKRQQKKADRKARNAAIKKLPFKQRVKERLKQGLNIVNKLNPGAALLRAGILAAMKLNLFKVPSKLRFAYWTDAQARRNNMDMGKFSQLKRIMKKLQTAYYGAGGNPAKLKKAILTGRGNRNRQVALNGLGYIPEEISDDDDLETILGEDLLDEIEGAQLDGLGAVATAATGAAIATATGLIGAIAALIGKLGGVFKKGSRQSEQEKIQQNTDNQHERTRKFSFNNLRDQVERFQSKITPLLPTRSASQLPTGIEPRLDPTVPQRTVFDNDANGQFDDPDLEQTKNKSSDQKPKKGNWFKENPGKTAAIGAGVVGTGLLVAYLVKQSKKKKRSLNGLDGKKGKKKKKAPKRKTTRRKPSTPTARRKAPTRRRTRPAIKVQKLK